MVLSNPTCSLTGRHVATIGILSEVVAVVDGVTSLGSDEVCSTIAAEEVVITSTGDEISVTTAGMVVVKYGLEEVGTTMKEEMGVVNDSCMEDEAVSCEDGEGAYEAEVLGTIFDEDSM